MLSSLPLLPANRVGLFRFSVGFAFRVGSFVTLVVRRLGFASFVALAACPLSLAFFNLPSFSSGGKVRSSLTSAFPIHRGKPDSLGGW